MPTSALPPIQLRTPDNTPWGHFIWKHDHHGFHADNARFVFTVAAWYVLSVMGILLSAHALACALDGNSLRAPPPGDVQTRRRWWWRRLLPLAVCAGSLVTDLSRGQVDIAMLTAIALALYLATRGTHFKAGLCLAIPVAIKLFPPSLLAYPFFRRQWRMAAGVVTGLFILLAVLPLATLGPARTTELYQCWIDVLLKPALGQGGDTSRLAELTGMGSTDNQSLLTIIHNWAHRSLPVQERPVKAESWERNTVYVTGALMIIATFWLMGVRRTDSPHELLVIAGLLIGIMLIASPVVHNFYYLLMLPLVAALLDSSLSREDQAAINWKLFLPVIVFAATDLLARMPHIGPSLRDYGVTALSLLWLLGAGAWFLAVQTKAGHFTPSPQK